MDATRQPEKLYTQSAISVATLFGGPLAAGILVRRNFINLGKPRYGEFALSLNIIFLLGIFLFLYLFPGEENNRIIYSGLPAIYTLIISILVEVFQGGQIREHKVNQLAFYSGWKAAGVGLISSSIFLVAGVAGYRYVEAYSFDSQSYNKGIMNFAENENIALRIYSQLDEGQVETIPGMISETGIPYWVRNIEIINSLNSLDNIPDDLKLQNEILIEYCQLRIKAYGLISKAIQENSSAYDTRIELIHIEIERLMEKLEEQTL